MYLIFDTETTGLPNNWKAPLTDFDNWPRLVQLAWQLHDIKGNLIEKNNLIIKPDNFEIPYNSTKIHGITNEIAHKKGLNIDDVLEQFIQTLVKTNILVGHNIEFDNNIVGCEFLRKNLPNYLQSKPTLDTKIVSTQFCEIPGGRGGGFKWPSLSELHFKLFESDFDGAHDASFDVDATARCFFELIKREVVPHSNIGMDFNTFNDFKSNSKSFFPEKKLIIKKQQEDSTEIISNAGKHVNQISSDIKFSHLHLHSKFSILQATCELDDIIDKAIDYKMPALALTDYSNMFGSFNFVNKVLNHEINKNLDLDNLRLKPIIGCEFNICIDSKNKSNRDNGYKLPILAKNYEGYLNLSKLSSYSYQNGFYYVPRIDKNILIENKKNLIVLSGSLSGPISQILLEKGESEARKEVQWWQSNFKDDFYLEINKHGVADEEFVNSHIISFSKEFQIKLIATNNVFYSKSEDATAHDILLCVKDGELKQTPIGKGRGYRYGMENDQYYFKSSHEMLNIFCEIPDAISNTNEVVNKIDAYKLKREVNLPSFNVPQPFTESGDLNDLESQNKYLKHICFEGAKKRYVDITQDIEERINFELKVIERSGYPGYFLIVQDFINKAREIGVSVGPGRGSAAGSVVAYCTGITDIDPIQYDLLFERFLNPDRISLPDIDIDFDDEGRNKIIDWVVSKYGHENVAQIVTYGKMAAKSSIRDTARVLNLPLNEADRIAKLVPDLTSLKEIFSLEKDELKKRFTADQLKNVNELISISKADDLASITINNAIKVEGSLRNIGTHACGIIITSDNLVETIPVLTSKDSDLLVTQYDNSAVENAGLLKMDFLGLKNLTIIKDCLKIIKHLHQKEIDIRNIELNDSLTFEIFKDGNTTGIFQFSSDGMRSHLKNLKPDKFDDLIAMNALYRPGPMEYIPNFIKRKHGKEEISYDLPEMEDFLSQTYGITVYQEQVMLLSQKLANFTRGEADSLRKGMGKKIKSVIDELKPKFVDGCKKNGYDETIVEKIWSDWEKFASYAFNKSHSTCYALIAYQTAYLKAHYPAELMASILANHMRDIKDITLYMEECKKMKIKVLCPDINESFYKFAVNKKSEIRFGLGAIKGVGESAVNSIVEERKQNGVYKNFSDFVKRVDLRSCNKRTIESLVLSGGFDSFEIDRSRYFHTEDGQSYIEKMIKFGNKIQQNKSSTQIDIFGGAQEIELESPKAPICEKWKTMEFLSKEKEVVGIYLSAHPLDDFIFESSNFSNSTIRDIKLLEKNKSRDLFFSCVIVDVEHRESKNGKKYAVVQVEDYTDSHKLYFFGEDYTNYFSFLNIGWAVLISGKIKKKFYNDEFEFKISNIKLLSEIVDSEVRNLRISVDIKDITKTLVEEIDSIINERKGKHTVTFNLIDKQNNYNVNLFSRKARVSLDRDFFKNISNINALSLEIKSE